MAKRNLITQEMREAVKSRFFGNKNNTTIVIAKELNYSIANTSQIITDLLNEKMHAVRTRKANQKRNCYE